MFEIAPSILSADFTRLAEEIAPSKRAARNFAFDVMDGRFVPNITIGLPVVKNPQSTKFDD
jgi:ribulose-phosphate 3-epimerase